MDPDCNLFWADGSLMIDTFVRRGYTDLPSCTFSLQNAVQTQFVLLKCRRNLCCCSILLCRARV
eukprot:2933347-Rhodomonas_salina.1